MYLNDGRNDPALVDAEGVGQACQAISFSTADTKVIAASLSASQERIQLCHKDHCNWSCFVRLSMLLLLWIALISWLDLMWLSMFNWHLMLDVGLL
jgi:hypothetical protein